MSTTCLDGFQVCVFDPPPDRQELGEVLKEHLDVPRADAMRLAASAPGLLPLRTSEAEANRLAEHLCATGLHSEAVCSGEVPQLHAAEDVHHVRCTPQGMEIVELHAATARTIPWESVEMLSIGQLPDGFARHFSEDGTFLTAARRAPRPSVMVTTTPGPELWLVARAPVRSLRIHHELMNYEYLGERRVPSSTVNFRQFVEDILRFAPHAFQTTATQTWLVSGPQALFAFESEEDFEHWTVLQLLVHRAMAAREQSWIRQADHTPPAAPAETTEEIWHCLHCGAVRHLPAGAEAPECCGMQMCNAAGEARRSWSEIPV